MSKPIYKKGDLLEAIQEGNWLRTKALLDAGADPDETDFYDNSATMLASVGGNAEIVRLLMDYGATNWRNALQGAARGGHIEVMQLLLDRGENIDRQDQSGNTALMCAAAQRQVEAVRWLLKKGARVDIRNNFVGIGMKDRPGEGNTALDHCKKAGNWAMVNKDGQFVSCDTKENQEIIKLLEAAEAIQKPKVVSRQQRRRAAPGM